MSSHKVIYDDQNEDTENKTDIIWDGETIVVPVEFTATPKDDYHEFAYWNKEDGTKADKKIPQTGIKSVFIISAILVTIIVAFILYKRNKYMNIK